MELTVIEHIKGPYVDLYPLGDVHLGSPDCDEELFDRTIETIAADDNAYAILNGDLLQSDLSSSVGSVYWQKYPPSEQKRIMREKLQPITNKILCMQGGNHDEGRSKEDASQIRDIAEYLGVLYTNKEMLLKLAVGAKVKNSKPSVYTVYATHGWASGRMIGGKANNLQRLSEIVLADIYIVSHTHTPMVFPDTYYVPDLHNNNVREIRRLYINTGSFQKRGEYPKSKGMRPTVLETPRVRLNGSVKRAEVIL